MEIITILLYFAIPLIKEFLIPLSIIQPPMLRIIAYPPGYPVEGQSWVIEVWGSQENYLRWRRVAGANVTMHTSTQGDLTFSTDSEGKVIVKYTSSLGRVSFEVHHKDYIFMASWAPQERFISNNIAYLILGFYGIGSPLLFWNVIADFLKHSKRDTVGKLLFWSTLILMTSGWLLSLYWFIIWRLGTEWGFGNTIAVIGVPILYDPHLFLITLGVVISSFLLKLKMVFDMFHRLPRP
jgi:hypothetical protein